MSAADTPSEDTPSVSARDALGYATRDEMLKLYGVLAVGWVGMFLGQFAIAARNTLLSLVGFPIVLAGVLAFLAGIVAIARKLLVES